MLVLRSLGLLDPLGRLRPVLSGLVFELELELELELEYVLVLELVCLLVLELLLELVCLLEPELSLEPEGLEFSLELELVLVLEPGSCGGLPVPLGLLDPLGRVLPVLSGSVVVVSEPLNSLGISSS
ncbi:MAG: hypothetical protein FWH26_07400 [Oscillospiraceae bacterium]|nr:hypothetical protein [Oscillospiraceae bacterium]